MPIPDLPVCATNVKSGQILDCLRLQRVFLQHRCRRFPEACLPRSSRWTGRPGFTRDPASSRQFTLLQLRLSKFSPTGELRHLHGILYEGVRTTERQLRFLGQMVTSSLRLSHPHPVGQLTIVTQPQLPTKAATACKSRGTVQLPSCTPSAHRACTVCSCARSAHSRSQIPSSSQQLQPVAMIAAPWLRRGKVPLISS